MKQKTQLRLFTLITFTIVWSPVIIGSIKYLSLSSNAPSKETIILLFLFITVPIALFSTLLCFIFYLISKSSPNPQTSIFTQLLILWSPTCVTIVSWLSHKFSASSGTTLIAPLILYLAIIATLLSFAFLFIQRKSQ